MAPQGPVIATQGPVIATQGPVMARHYWGQAAPFMSRLDQVEGSSPQIYTESPHPTLFYDLWVLLLIVILSPHLRSCGGDPRYVGLLWKHICQCIHDGLLLLCTLQTANRYFKSINQRRWQIATI